MSDSDRGAYSPYGREDLSFDPRSSQRRRPFPLTLAVSAVVLVIMGGAAVMYYQSGIRGPNEPPRAVGTPVGKIKTPAGGAAAASADPAALDVYVQDPNAPSATTGAPVYTPDPEQPQARPVASAAAQAAALPVASVQAVPLPAARPAARPAKAAPAKAPAYASIDEAVAASRTDAGPAKPLKTKTVAKPIAQKPVAQKPVALASAKGKPATAAPLAAKKTDAEAVADAKGGNAAVQIGAFSSKALADAEFGKVRGPFAKFLSGKGHHVDQVQRGGSTLWRAAYTGFSKPQAQAFCGALKAAGRACIIK
jgi:hypothetical protein